MKATMGTTYHTLLAHLNRINRTLEDLRVQSATGKKINKPSDDPSAIRPMLNARTQIKSSDRFIRTMDSGLDQINSMDGHLSHMNDVLVRLKEISIASINDSLDSQNRLTYAEEVKQLRQEMYDSANAQLDGKYLFSGFQVHTKPFVDNPAYDPVLDPRPVLYNGDSGEFNLEIGPSEKAKINLTGNELLMGDADFDGVTDPGAVDIFAVMASVEQALRNNDPAAVSGQLDNIETGLEQIRSNQSLMGNAGRRLETAKDRMEQTNIQMQTILSRYEDADLVETITNMTQQETALQAALSVTGRLSQLSILNYV
ncbi:flagellar hook-associated protein FlgL [Geothermobacter hydrogeniphilus]|uniref:Flagellar hook-associated protein 3 n=1 Tax=Geothermobacter hydrogeniphilus TaxID=1969733 RepID=A0A1X0YEI0_9BACT|nr:flagellar hook-associated protein FlgL [Geothermobacter hydrogeniphilus]ORJ63493.1 flagellar hook-associated protein 3 [Geothermobacter hydrogeniphilus]